MNELVCTENQIFMCICGASSSGKTHLLLNMLTSRSDDIFWPRFEKVILFYRHWQTSYEQFDQDEPSKVFFENVVQTENETGLAKLDNQKHQTPGHKTSHSRIDTLISKLLDHQSQESKYHTTFGNEKALAILMTRAKKFFRAQPSPILQLLVDIKESMLFLSSITCTSRVNIVSRSTKIQHI